jgi:hypothetical protein
MPYTVKLRANVFERAAKLAGFKSDYALARAMDVNRSTVTRVRSGHLQPGSAFIGGVLIALAPMQFEDLFEVGHTPVHTESGPGRPPAPDESRQQH